MGVETATLLFTDLVGSTELMSAVGESAMEAMRREHVARLRDAIGGTGGREVKSLGDGLMVVFDGAGAALACAVAMQQSVTAQRTPLGVALAIRIGVAAGEVDVVDDDYFGVPVVEAARLCASADGGEILASELVHFLVRSRGGFDLERVGPLELKGLPEPVEAFRLRWEPVASSDGAGIVPVSARLRLFADATLAGRAEALSLLADAAKVADAGTRRAVLVSGEPGIGKTTLAASFALQTFADGATVLYGRCDEDVVTPYQPWVEALGHLLEHADGDLVAAHVEACGRVLGRVVPQLDGRVVSLSAPAPAASADADVERHLLFAAVVDLLARASSERLVVLVLDDLHWADPSTVQLLGYLLTVDPAMRILVIGTFRDSDIGLDHPLSAMLGRFHRERGVDRVALAGLADDELLELLEALAGHEMDDAGVALRDALRAETDGNPFFVGELLRHLRDTDVLRRDTDGRWVSATDITTAGLPVSIREVVGSRVVWLGVETQRVLTLASVIGRDFDVELLAQVAGGDVDGLIDLCDVAVAAGVLRSNDQLDRYSFAHALIQRALYDALSPSRCARVHRQVAESIEEACGNATSARAGELAYHWGHAVRAHDAEKAVCYARLAGDEALARLAPADALRWYSDAFALLDNEQLSNTTGVELLIGIARARILVGDPDHRSAIVSAARAAATLGDGALLAQAVLAAQTPYNTHIGIDEPLIALVREALALAGPGDSLMRARLLCLLSSQLLHSRGVDDERAAAASEAIAIARRLGDERTFVDVIIFGDEARSVPDLVATRLVDAEEACGIAERLGDPAMRFGSHSIAAYAALACDRDAFERHLSVIDSLSAAVVVPTMIAVAATHHLFVAMLDGDPDTIDAESNVTFQRNLDAGAPEPAAAVFEAAALISAWQRGTLKDLVPFIEAQAAESTLPVYRAVLAWAQAISGDHDSARASLASAAIDGFAVPYDPNWLVAQSVWGEAAVRCNDTGSAAVLISRLEPHVELFALTRGSVTGLVGHVAGRLRMVLGDFDIAVNHLEAALTRAVAMRSPFMVADVRCALAAALHRRRLPGDHTRARGLTTEAYEAAISHGYGYVELDAAEVRRRLDGDADVR